MSMGGHSPIDSIQARGMYFNAKCSPLPTLPTTFVIFADVFETLWPTISGQSNSAYAIIGKPKVAAYGRFQSLASDFSATAAFAEQKNLTVAHRPVVVHQTTGAPQMSHPIRYVRSLPPLPLSKF